MVKRRSRGESRVLGRVSQRSNVLPGFKRAEEAWVVTAKVPGMQQPGLSGERNVGCDGHNSESATSGYFKPAGEAWVVTAKVPGMQQPGLSGERNVGCNGHNSESATSGFLSRRVKRGL